MTNTDQLIVATYAIKSAARGDYLKKTLNALINRGANATPQNASGAISRLDAAHHYPLSKILNPDEGNVNSTNPAGRILHWLQRVTDDVVKTRMDPRKHTARSREEWNAITPTQIGNIFGRTVGNGVMPTTTKSYGAGVAAKYESLAGKAVRRDPNFYIRAQQALKGMGPNPIK